MSNDDGAASSNESPRDLATGRVAADAPSIDAAGFGSWHWSVAANTLTFSALAETMHGLEPGSFAGTLPAFRELINSDDRDRTIATLLSTTSGGGNQFVTYRTNPPQGASQWITTWVNVTRTDQSPSLVLTAICLAGGSPPLDDDSFQRDPFQLSRLLDEATDGITVQTPGGQYVYANVAALRMLGVASTADLNALSVSERRARLAVRDASGHLIPRQDFPTTRALQGEQPPEQLLELQPLRGGDRRWVILKSTPIIDDQGAVRYVVNRLRDVSRERWQAEEREKSEARYRLLFESNPIPMWVFDLHTLRFLAVNDAALHQYGWSREEFLALTLLDIRPPEDHPAILRKLARIAAEPDGLDVAGVWRHRKRDGTLLDVEVTTHALIFDGRDARVSIAINITERARHERRLARLSALTAALAAALVPREVARVITQYAVDAGAGVAAVAAYAPADETITVLHRRGYPEHIPKQSDPFPVASPTLLGHVVRTGQAIVAPTWEEFDQRHPELQESRRFAGEAGLGAGIILPLLVDERPIGVLKMAFREPRAFPRALLDELQTIAYLCAQALERAQLYAAEQAARAQAEAGERVARRAVARTALMAELSHTLTAAGLDRRAVLAAVVRTVAEHTGDACTIAMFGEGEEDGAVAALHHLDSVILADLNRLLASEWRDAITTMAWRTMDTGEAVLIPAFGDQLGSAVGTASADAAAITVHSLMILPFRAYDRIIGVLALLRLVPDRPYTAEDLAFFHELSNRAALALDNARLYDETQAAVQARDEFLSAAAHELRTPITTVKGYAQMLLRAQIRAGLASDHASQFLQAIDEATERLRVLADDLLDVSHLRLGQMPLHLQPLDLVDLAGRTIRRLEPGLDARYTLILESQWPAAVVHADPNRIEQVLGNILNNAVKYSPAGGEIRTVIATDGAGIRLSVRDPGIGLPPEAVESIFAPFNRADNAVRDNIPGLGLGLYICDSIVRRHRRPHHRRERRRGPRHHLPPLAPHQRQP